MRLRPTGVLFLLERQWQEHGDVRTQRLLLRQGEQEMVTKTDKPRRRRRTTPVTQPIAPISMADIAREFAEAMKAGGS